MAENTILDNSKYGKVVDFIKNTINKNYENNMQSHIDIVSAYFSIHAFNALKEELTNKISKTRFIIGESESVKNLGKKNKRLKIFKIQDDNIKLDNVLQQNKIAKECYNWIKKNVEIRTAPKKDNHKALIHGKMYYIEPDNPCGKVNAVVGSANFTSPGLGIDKCSNYELNTVIDNDSTKKDLKDWFEDLWTNNTEDAKAEILNYIKEIYKENSPEEVYYKTLYHLFEERNEEEEEDVSKSEKFVKTKIWQMLYAFQKDAVNAIIKRLNLYNGCILADSVGLGKTYTALGVIQYFITHYKKPNILVLAPKRLAGNWEIYTNNNPKNIFDDDDLNITFVTHSGLTSGDIDEKIKLWNFDLVVIDESHNFRNGRPSKRDENGNIVKISRYDKLLNKILKEGKRAPKVLLLSATPVNTDLTTDLNNQFKLITFEKDNAYSAQNSLGISSIIQTLKDANKEYNTWALNKNRNKQELLKQFKPNFYKLLDALTIARSRKQIINNYTNTEKEIGKFPKRKNPEGKFMDIDTKREFPTFAEIDKKISQYSLSLFSPSKYLLSGAGKEKGAGNMTQEDRENYLIGMMKAGFLKRLESSIYSFTKSMENTKNKINERIQLIKDYNKHKENYNKNDKALNIDAEENWLDINKDDEDLTNNFYKELYKNLDNDDKKYTVGKKLQYSLSELDIDKWEKDLREDLKKIEAIYDIAKEVSAERDEKLAELKRLIKLKSKEPNKKILLFTTYADTATYLYEKLEKFVHSELKLNIALVTGQINRTTYGEADYDTILENFSPCSKLNLEPEDAPKEQIDIIIATDCISEGQNLQDCDTVVNYDIHWNPVRLIQRFGRIDRIGSRNKEIQMINFWPTDDLDEYINLKPRVENRMVIVDATAAADDNLLRQAEDADSTYRDEQLKRIMEEKPIEGIEDSDSILNVSDISLEEFREDLKDFIESKKKELKETPNGINAIVPNELEDGTKVPAGIIFCLRQKGIINDNEEQEKDKEEEQKENRNNNELYPYYMVYVQNNGTILYTYENSREILNKYKLLCLGKKEPFMDLCHKFNEQIQTQEGMKLYNDILKAATNGTVERYKGTMTNNLISNRKPCIPTVDKQVKSDDDFELITWLIIDGEE